MNRSDVEELALKKMAVTLASELLVEAATVGKSPERAFLELGMLGVTFQAIGCVTLSAVYVLAALMVDDGTKRGEKDLKNMVRCHCKECKGTDRDASVFMARLNGGPEAILDKLSAQDQVSSPEAEEAAFGVFQRLGLAKEPGPKPN